MIHHKERFGPAILELVVQLGCLVKGIAGDTDSARFQNPKKISGSGEGWGEKMATRFALPDSAMVRKLAIRSAVSLNLAEGVTHIGKNRVGRIGYLPAASSRME